MKFEVGDKVRMKKPHPCGNDVFEIVRIGMDFRLRCTMCDRQLWLSRHKFEKSVKKSLSC